MKDSCLVVLSGGQDSTTCLFWAKKEFKKVYAISFLYGQKHSIEINSATAVAKLAKVDGHEIVEIGPVLQGTSPLVNNREQLEMYTDWKSLPGGLEKTFVPCRNALFFVLAANRAYCMRIEHMVTGICQEDFGGYPDCRDVFRAAMAHALTLSLDKNLEILAPLMHLSKADSVRLAYSLEGCPNALAYTHTSYDGNYPPVSHDHATLLRAKGFEQADYPDPLIVRAYVEGLMELPATDNYNVVRKNTTQWLTDNSIFVCSENIILPPGE